MAFGAKKIFPIDTKPGTAVGVAIPFNAPAVFFQTYTTQDAIRNNLLNFFLTNKTERYLNNGFGANLRAFIFEQISEGTLEGLENKINLNLSTVFPNVNVTSLEILQNPDSNTLTIQLKYSVNNSNVNDNLIIQI